MKIGKRHRTKFFFRIAEHSADRGIYLDDPLACNVQDDQAVEHAVIDGPEFVVAATERLLYPLFFRGIAYDGHDGLRHARLVSDGCRRCLARKTRSVLSDKSILDAAGDAGFQCLLEIIEELAMIFRRKECERISSKELIDALGAVHFCRSRRS